jgi:hypothetical protein
MPRDDEHPVERGAGEHARAELRRLDALRAGLERRAADVLTREYHGFSEAYTLVNGSFGRKWQQGRITTMVKMNNIFNDAAQQHVFGDLVTRSAVFEVRLKM